jgi:hypothetical protein
MCHFVFLRRIPKDRSRIEAAFCLSFEFEILVLTINNDQECLIGKPKPRFHPAVIGSYVKALPPVAQESIHGDLTIY